MSRFHHRVACSRWALLLTWTSLHLSSYGSPLQRDGTKVAEPSVTMFSPAKGSCYQSKILISAEVDTGTGGPSTDLILDNPGAIKMCYSGGLEAKCTALVGGAPIEEINVKPPGDDGLSTVYAWLQANNVAISFAHALGQPDMVFLWDTHAAHAAQALQARLSRCKENTEHPLTSMLTSDIATAVHGCGALCQQDGGTMSPSKFFPERTVHVNCAAIFSDAVFLNKGHGLSSAPHSIPANWVDEFTLNGKSELEQWYMDQKYVGSTSETPVWTSELVNQMVDQAKQGILSGNYGVISTNALLDALDHSSGIQGGRVLVIGSENPWVEACVLAKGALSVTTLEYGSINSTHPQVTTIQPDEFQRRWSELPLFDAVVTYSSVEHSGLGRYGDSLNPWGDVLAIAHARCVSREGASLTIAVPFGTDTIAFNVHRVYGAHRYPYLASNWRQVWRQPHVSSNWNGEFQQIYVFETQQSQAHNKDGNSATSLFLEMTQREHAGTVLPKAMEANTLHHGSSYCAALTYHLGLAMLRIEPQSDDASSFLAGGALSGSLTGRALDLFTEAEALGVRAATGAREEAEWLLPENDGRGNAFPCFPCFFAGELHEILPRKHHTAEADFNLSSYDFGSRHGWDGLSVAFISYATWGDARVMLQSRVGAACEALIDDVPLTGDYHLKFLSTCNEAALSAAKVAVEDACGNLQDLDQMVAAQARIPTDINEHLLSLSDLASRSGGSIVEIGVRGVVSSWAFLHGLLRATSANSLTSTSCGGNLPFIIQIDIDDCFSASFQAVARRANVRLGHRWQDDLSVALPHDLDVFSHGDDEHDNIKPPITSVGLLFIDTLHVYGQLKRELALYSPFIEKFIALHDTTTDGEVGEVVRARFSDKDNGVFAAKLGWPTEDVTRGLWLAVEEFLAEHVGEWELLKRWENNNGLTVLQRVGLWRGQESVTLALLPLVPGTPHKLPAPGLNTGVAVNIAFPTGGLLVNLPVGPHFSVNVTEGVEADAIRMSPGDWDLCYCVDHSSDCACTDFMSLVAGHEEIPIIEYLSDGEHVLEAYMKLRDGGVSSILGLNSVSFHTIDAPQKLNRPGLHYEGLGSAVGLRNTKAHHYMQRATVISLDNIRYAHTRGILESLHATVTRHHPIAFDEPALVARAKAAVFRGSSMPSNDKNEEVKTMKAFSNRQAFEDILHNFVSSDHSIAPDEWLFLFEDDISLHPTLTAHAAIELISEGMHRAQHSSGLLLLGLCRPQCEVNTEDTSDGDQRISNIDPRFSTCHGTCAHAFGITRKRALDLLHSLHVMTTKSHPNDTMLRNYFDQMLCEFSKSVGGLLVGAHLVSPNDKMQVGILFQDRDLFPSSIGW